ncbi:MAG: response regulator [Lachnospiraceae bacterium]|nr:response regulator [Lachnospiraceae bacterium]
MKILVADDHKTIVDGIILDLKDIHPDAEIVGAFKSKDILDACLNNQFDVIFLDIDMPQANGIDIAKRVLEKYPRTNIIYITGYEKYAVESYETNASTFLLKPITKKAIEKALDNLRFPISDIPEEMLLAEFSGKGYIGKRIQYYRELRGISRNELAELLNVTPPTVHRWETGVRTPDLATTIQLAKILSIKLDELING